MTATASHLEHIAARAQTLYSRPTVAMEVVRLAELPRVDAQAIKRVVEQDPALACKLLRVVNSSLYGLSRPVADLNQAIGLLGIKPLKLLVLGFSLPDALFAEVAARELRWYWTNTLTRAVAARMLSEQLWHQPGDEAFVASMLQDIGILVLMREVGSPYVKFLSGAIKEKCNLAALEQDTLGFDHAQLSAALLARWQLPQRLVDAIATPKRQARLSRMPAPDADLPQILHLAELLVQLVGQQRLRVLKELLEAGKVYRGMTKQKLAALVEGLQPQVDQLAEVLSLELSEKRDYVQMLLAAHQKMASLSEDVAGTLHAESDDDRAHHRLLADTRELSRAMQSFLDGGDRREASDESARQWTAQHAAHERNSSTPQSRIGDGMEVGNDATMFDTLVGAVNRCRELRHELSILLAEPSGSTSRSNSGPQSAGRRLQEELRRACAQFDHENVALVPLDGGRTAVILSDCDRKSAVGVAQSAISAIGKSSAAPTEAGGGRGTTVSIGVATVSVVPRNFDPLRLIESAGRCVSAARACGISTVKSIEV